MQNTKIIKSIENLDVDYKEKLKTFINEYFRLIYTVKKDASNLNRSQDMRYTIKELFEWASSYGSELFYSTINSLKNNVSEEMNGFIDYYSFLLESSKNDEYNLIDQLFSIPGQFAREFEQKEERITIKSYNAIHVALEQKYEFHTTGTFEQVPCFFRGGSII